ncbi:hypothetical protein CVT26_000774 [Gymnopilus dilepis]|uniref:Uncharacterized protein n=1 Tax=Gymnopilus dilepis TaxID=231916 RepID=A0A409YLH3_9AGAR|nr:hypothetical protein CVT26_000774 [Gymnopilus dilepis]
MDLLQIWDRHRRRRPGLKSPSKSPRHLKIPSKYHASKPKRSSNVRRSSTAAFCIVREILQSSSASATSCEGFNKRAADQAASSSDIGNDLGPKNDVGLRVFNSSKIREVEEQGTAAASNRE